MTDCCVPSVNITQTTQPVTQTVLQSVAQPATTQQTVVQQPTQQTLVEPQTITSATPVTTNTVAALQGIQGPAGPVGPQGPQGLGVDLNFTYQQSTASTTWSIAHNLNKHPSVTTFDSTGGLIVGNVAHVDANNLIVSFNAATGGTAYLN